MSDVVADIVARCRLDTNVVGIANAAQAAGDQAARAIQNIEARVKSLDSSLSSAKGALVAFFAFDKVASAARATAHSLGDFEQMTLGVAGVLQATGGMSSFADAMLVGKQRLAELNDYAKTHTGTFEDYAHTFQAILAPVRSAGGNSGQAAELAKRLLPVAHAMGGKEAMHSLGYQLSEAITIGLAGRMAPELQRIIKATGISKEAFNAMNGEQRIASLLKGAEKFRDMVKAGENTMAAQTTTLHSNLLGLGRTAGAEVWESLKSTLADVNHWIEANRRSLDDTAKLIGGVLRRGLESLVSLSAGIASHWKTIAAAAGAWAAYSGGRMAVTAGSGIVAYLSGGAMAAAATRAAQAAAIGGLGQMAARGVAGAAGGAATGGAIAAALAAAGPAIGLAIATAIAVGIGALIGKAISDSLASARDVDAQRQHAIDREARFNHFVADRLKDKYGIGPSEAVQRFVQSKGRFEPRYMQSLADTQQAGYLHAIGLDSPIAKQLLERNREHKGPQTHVEMNVTIQMDVRDVQDPDRIASMTTEKLAKLARSATQSRFTLVHP